jgi:hypothetical protein
MAFSTYDGRNVLTFIEINNQFFISYGKDKITISPMNRIIKMEYNKEKTHAKVYFSDDSIKPLDLNIAIPFMKEFVRHFIEYAREPNLFPGGTIIMIDTKDLFQHILLNNYTKGIIAAIIPDDLELKNIHSKKKRKFWQFGEQFEKYTKYKGIRIPILEYALAHNGTGEKTFYKVIKSRASYLI